MRTLLITRTLAVLLLGSLVAGSALADKRGHRGDSSQWSKWENAKHSVAPLVQSEANNGSDQSALWSDYRAKLAVSTAKPERSNRYSRYSDRLQELKWSNLNSGVCDGLRGGRGGLKMLCVAFCELQACQPDYSLENPFQNCAKSSERILARYESRMGAGDPEMPCVKQPETAPECPCWTRNELAGLRAPSATDLTASCMQNINSGTAITNYDFWMLSSDQAAPTTYNVTLSSIGFSERDGSAMCSMVDSCSDGNCTNATRYMAVTPEQLAACEADVAQSAIDRSLNCTVMP